MVFLYITTYRVPTATQLKWSELPKVGYDTIYNKVGQFLSFEQSCINLKSEQNQINPNKA